MPHQLVNEILELHCLDILEEIRIRANQKTILKLNNKEIILSSFLNENDLLYILNNMCKNSIYSYQSQICEGYLQLIGGHRVGVTGQVVFQDGCITNISYISSMNIRIAKQVKNCCKEILKYILDIQNNSIKNTLIVSPPGCGKTTILKDLIRNISNGIEEKSFYGRNVGVVDERGEIASMYKGKVNNDLGIRTDVISNVSKSVGMKLLIRSMAPDVIAADEIGKKEDIDAIEYAMCSGVKGIYTAHGEEYIDLINNPILKNILNLKIIEIIIFLDKEKRRKVKEIYILDKNKNLYKKIGNIYDLDENLDNKFKIKICNI